MKTMAFSETFLSSLRSMILFVSIGSAFLVIYFGLVANYALHIYNTNFARRLSQRSKCSPSNKDAPEVLPWNEAKESIIEATDLHKDMFSSDKLLEILKEVHSAHNQSTQDSTRQKSSRSQSFSVKTKSLRMPEIGSLNKEKAPTMDMGKNFRLKECKIITSIMFCNNVLYNDFFDSFLNVYVFL